MTLGFPLIASLLRHTERVVQGHQTGNHTIRSTFVCSDRGYTRVRESHTEDNFAVAIWPAQACPSREIGNVK